MTPDDLPNFVNRHDHESLSVQDQSLQTFIKHCPQLCNGPSDPNEMLQLERN